MEWIGNFIKLLFEYAWIFFITSSCLLFFPQSWIDKLCLTEIKNNYNSFIGLIFLSTSIIVIVKFGKEKWEQNKQMQQSLEEEKRAKQQRIEIIQQLDEQEKSVLREYHYPLKKNTISLPTNDPTVAGLLKSGVLIISGGTEQSSGVYGYLPISIKEDFKSLITPERIDFPTGKPSQSEIKSIEDKRPEFMKKAPAESVKPKYPRFYRRPTI